MRRIISLLIRLYQRFLSPLKPPRYRCRFYPSCSSYALQAIQRFGVFRGLILGCKRIVSCNPWSEGGLDPVPLEWPGWKKIFYVRRG